MTGLTGLIGKELVSPLKDAGFDVHAITIDAENPANGVTWWKGSLFDTAFVGSVMSDVKPTHLLNMAWATTGDYLTSDINYRFLEAGKTLAKAFVGVGGGRAVYAGTCFEYRFKDGPLSEHDELDPEKNAYVSCKNKLRLAAEEIFSAASVSFGYGRIFYVYGRNEAKSRLTGMVVDNLRKGERVVIRSGPLKKDYVYAKDIANAFVALLDSDVRGAVNICTGRTVTIREYVLALADKMGRRDLVVFEDDCADQPTCIVGDPARLVREVGYVPRYELQQALDEVVETSAGIFGFCS